MKFKALPVTSLEDATIDFEQLSAVSILNSQPANFLQLLTAGTMQIVSGSGSATFTAALDSAAVVVTHGLGRTPVYVSAFNSNAAGVWFSAGTFTTTQVTFVGSYRSSITGSVPFKWIAIG